MNESADQERRERELNPALRRRTDDSYDTRSRTPPPSESASIKHQEGRHWPLIWLVVTVVGVLIALFILFW
jgi:hypothetical protein